MHQQIRTQEVVFWIRSVDLGQIRAQTSPMLSHIPKAEDQIGGDLMLHFQVPILDHARAPVVWRDVIHGILSECVQRRVLGVARRWIGGETGI